MQGLGLLGATSLVGGGALNLYFFQQSCKLRLREIVIPPPVCHFQLGSQLAQSEGRLALPVLGLLAHDTNLNQNRCRENVHMNVETCGNIDVRTLKFYEVGPSHLPRSHLFYDAFAHM